jgi:hypothetical protein
VVEHLLASTPHYHQKKKKKVSSEESKANIDVTKPLSPPLSLCLTHTYIHQVYLENICILKLSLASYGKSKTKIFFGMIFAMLPSYSQTPGIK